MRTYDHREIEKRAQETWAALKLHQTDLADESKEPYYLLTEFPYPSGDLHIGHWYAFAVTDIYARILRAQGKNVLFPIGFDSFGLPAENAAIQNGANPKTWTYANMERMRAQLKSMGASFDWSKEIITCEPSYYQWTEWLFLKLFEHGLAYRKEASVKWCPKDQTVLANEQVVEGACERCGTPVEEKRLTQWFLKITEYAERLLKDLEGLPWREEIKEAQRAWIGKSEGAKIRFEVAGRKDESIAVFTTRPDTLYGATYIVLAPEHSIVQLAMNDLRSRSSNHAAVRAYVETTQKKTERERSENKEKTGVKLEGVMAVNPATKKEIPVYVADYVLASYGTGAVMAVPAHDERDFEFAKKYDLPIRQVVRPVFGIEDKKPDTAWRTTVSAFVRSKGGTKVLLIKWKEYDWLTGVIGGMDNGETAEAAAVREVFEETGYRTRPVFASPIKIESHYFAEHKNEWRARIDTPVLLELEDEKQESVSDEEAAKHEIRWTDLSEAFGKEMFRNNKLAMELAFGIMNAYTKPRFDEPGILVESGVFSGRNSEEAKWDIVKAVSGERATEYRIRDWLVSRQRYWGCPIPIVYDPKGKPHAVPKEHLPWLLPTDVDFKPTGKAPLASSKELRERVEKLFGKGWTPEYDTLDVFVDSSWYFTRYLDSKDDHDFSDQALMKKWLPVNRYSGGAEHTTMHLLYSRFFYKVLYDLALVPTPEPYNERFNRGIILGTDGQKMSKRWGNIVNPDEMKEKYGADAVRCYLAFIGPYNEVGHYPWNLDGVRGMRRFLERVFALSEKLTDKQVPESLTRECARAAKKVKGDSDRFKFNTALSALMVLLNALEKEKGVPKATYRNFLILLAPFAPHLARELWKDAGGEGEVSQAAWPSYDAALLATATVSITVQVAGRRRGSIELPSEAGEAEAVAEASKIPAVSAALAGKKPARVVYVVGKILNLVP